jgi:Na+-translocating ferredoxin:NAD+ oxidoreductase RnfC subunit
MRAFAAGVETTSEAARQAMLCCECGVCELYACPMGLSPRRINIAVKQAMRAAGQKFEGSREVSGARDDWREFRHVPVPRLAARVGIAAYMDIHPADCREVRPESVRIPLRQHIGAPAKATVAPGETVAAGQVIGEIPEGALGARVHASIDGVVTGVDQAVSIKGA